MEGVLSVTEQLKQTRVDISNRLTKLLLEYSEIYRSVRRGDPNFTSRPYSWRDLPLEGQHVQAKLLEDYGHFHSIVEVLIKGLSEGVREKLQETRQTVIEVIEQDSNTHWEAAKKALQAALGAMNEQGEILEGLYDESDGLPTFVPDTNSLIYNPDLEIWSFDHAAQFCLVLIPVVASELDSLKINHRNQIVRRKAERLIRQIKEYRRRGRLTEGVHIRRGVSSLQAIAVEPRFEESLPWLDSENNDDRLIASFLEVVRARPRSPVVLVSRDLNVQNKAEFARLPCIEPPERINNTNPNSD